MHLMLLVFTIGTLGHRVLGQHFVQQTITKNHHEAAPHLKQVFINEDLFQQFKDWQNSFIQEPQVVQTKNDYGGNPWLQINNPNPGYYPGQPQPPQQGGYFPPPSTLPPPTRPPQTQPPQTQPPQNGNGGYFPTQAPPQTGGYYPTQAPPQSTPDTPEVAALRKYCLKPRGQFPSKSCNKYVNCWDDTIVEQECPSGLLFSDKGYCDYDYNVNCNGRQVAPVTQPPTMPASNAKCPTLFGNYRCKTNCSEFYVCNHGQPIKFSCPAGLYYSTELGVCDYPYNVDCINPRPLQPTHEIPTPPPAWPNNPYNVQRIHSDLIDQTRTCIPNTVYRLAEDCSTVAICRDDGRSEVVKCGFQTAFDTEKGLCVAKHLAAC